MTLSKNVVRLIPMIAVALMAYAKKSPPLEVAGVTCQTPPPLHCPDKDCSGKMVTEEGSAIEPKTGREFFLDYPCNLKKGEKVTFYGGGSDSCGGLRPAQAGKPDDRYRCGVVPASREHLPRAAVRSRPS